MKLKLSSKILLSLLILRLFTNTYAEDISVEESDLNFESLSSTIAIVDMPENINKETGVIPYLNQIEIHPFNQRIELRKYMDYNKIQPIIEFFWIYKQVIFIN